MKCTVFYSWQGSLPNRTNRGFIQAELDAAGMEVKTDDEITVVPVIDRDTADVPGAPDIGATILTKIDSAAAFVCDVSIINSGAPEERQTPNPNVLIELGYALKALGWARVVMVMNTAFGRPEDLPFDLRQKRVLTYALPDGSDKAAARKELRGKLIGALKPILLHHQEALAAAAVVPPSPLPADEAVKAINESRPNQWAAVKRFMKWLVDELAKPDPQAAGGGPAETLVAAIERTRVYVDDFGKVAEAVAEMGSRDGLRGLVRGLEYVLERRAPPLGFAGSYRDSDFDLFIFHGHELCVILFAHLIRAERWPLLAEAVSEPLHWRNAPRGAQDFPVAVLSRHVQTLDRLSKERALVSFHAFLLKERHDGTRPVGNVPFDEFVGADLLLFLSTFGGAAWYPRSGVYLPSRLPRFLLASKTSQGAKTLTAMLGLSDCAAMKTRVQSAYGRLGEILGQTSIDTFEMREFDPKNIATT